MEKTRKTFWEWCGGTARDRRNELRILGWMLLWIGSWLGVTLAIKEGWLAAGWPSTTATLVTAVLGLRMIGAYRRFLREADELRRKIEFDALALAFGVGLVGAFTYWLLEVAGAVAEVDILDLVLLMIVTYSAGVVLGQRRYA